MIHNPIFKGFNPDPCICRKGNSGLSFKRYEKLGTIYTRTDR